MNKRYLFTPGPTPIPPEALLTMAQPIDYHRSAEATEVIREVLENLKHVFQTQHEVLILTSSGTGAMEGAVANLLSPGDAVIAIRSGKFGHRWGEICQAYGMAMTPIDLPWGHSVDPEQVAQQLKRAPHTKAVLATLCETSTGALHDVQALASITRETPTLLVVDAISALGADDLQMDAWGVDVVVSGSQKGLMTPPGLAFAALNERAWEAVARSTSPKYYFDFQRARDALEKPTTPYTPAITLLLGLQQALRQMREEGIRNVIARHARLAQATRAGVQALGLELFARHPANAVTSVTFPHGLDTQAFNRFMRDRHGITYAGGQDQLRGKIIRIAHLGWADENDVVVALSALERGLSAWGYPVKVGAGVTAAQESLSQPIS